MPSSLIIIAASLPASDSSEFFVPHPATLKNDDAEDSGDEADDDDEFHLRAEAKAFRSDDSKKAPSTERQPTGRVVGIIKRNWRA